MTRQQTIRNTSIKQLYPLALAEGEGVGTAYEYFAKRLVLRPWLKQLPPIKRLLIAGLPEKYGSSLDYLLLAEEMGATAVIIEDRPELLDKFQQSLAQAQAQGYLTAVQPQLKQIPNLTQLSDLDAPFDLAISNEVLQRLPAAERIAYGQVQMDASTAVALFCPNADNPDHANHSGLATLSLPELQSLSAISSPSVTLSGYIDMPPFPTGVTRNEEQRVQAESGALESFAMWGLGMYARLEKVLPAAVRRQKSHIIYALLSGK
ncbi:MAG: hypothetical protein GY796_36400 [Chloroflexi bacterium]|nr:hypothetical protein [Chloroflexota bacterium]